MFKSENCALFTKVFLFHQAGAQSPFNEEQVSRDGVNRDSAIIGGKTTVVVLYCHTLLFKCTQQYRALAVCVISTNPANRNVLKVMNTHSSMSLFNVIWTLIMFQNMIYTFHLSFF